MGQRGEKRLATTLVPVQVTVLGGLQVQTCGRILDVFHNRLRLGLTDFIPVGSVLRIEFEGSQIIGDVCYCDLQNTWYATGLFVKKILIGESELARLIADLVQQPDTFQPVDGQ